MAEVDTKAQEQLLVKARFDELVATDLDKERRSYTVVIVMVIVVILILLVAAGAYYKRDTIMARFKPSKTQASKAPSPVASPPTSTNKITITTE